MPPFGSHLNFLDPQKTEDGQLYAPIRYKQIVKECYLISKNVHTSYLDLLQITPSERYMMLDFLRDEAKQNQERFEKLKAEREANKSQRRHR